MKLWLRNKAKILLLSDHRGRPLLSLNLYYTFAIVFFVNVLFDTTMGFKLFFTHRTDQFDIKTVMGVSEHT